jgi:anti-sigma factor RsiW
MPDPSPPDCARIDPLLTPYVDGELAASDKETVDSHVRACAGCRARVDAEQAVHRLMRARRPDLLQRRAPETLRARCAALATQPSDPPARVNNLTPAANRRRWLAPKGGASGVPAAGWRQRMAPLAMAAALVLLVGAAFLYRLTDSSTRVMAAELTADHVKCFMMNSVLGTAQAPSVVESSMAASFGWDAHLPEEPHRAGLELVGGRPCLYGEGRVAHIMYRHNGKPVSVFMLPKKRRPEELRRVMGHEAAIWSEGDRTFVLIAREPRSEVERIAEFVHASLR